ncbi:MAG: hypothetical protein HY976_00345 [Candidatus Kerfeldbacteria bacterium]|nr:hypothetical protein [Candidatus Kerfeldbacteria bacterium]
MKKYFITSAVLLVVATLYSMWRTNCLDGCKLDQIVMGWPVFLRTPYAPESGQHPEFFLVPLLINIGWSAAASLLGWTVFETFGRWQDRQRPPELPRL